MNNLPRYPGLTEKAEIECRSLLIDFGIEEAAAMLWDDLEVQNRLLHEILLRTQEALLSYDLYGHKTLEARQAFQIGAATAYLAIEYIQKPVPLLGLISGITAIEYLQKHGYIEVFEQSLQMDSGLQDIIGSIAGHYAHEFDAHDIMKHGAGCVRFFLGWQQQINVTFPLN